jgi:hypothetical protein
MGIKASPTCVMNFDEATGYLVGELNNGLSHMFTMMNYERLSMGLQANGLADSAYQVAADYAKERVQGRAPKGPQQPEATADPLLVHPDVRRLLLTIRANVLAGRSLSIFAAMQLDVSRFHPEPEARARADKLVSLLIPVQKAYCTDRGFDACVMAQQVLGGHGYVAEWGLEQNVRDARIAQIYEGANGIQALDLMGRKTVRANGQLLALLSEEMDAFVAEQAGVAEMQGYLQGLAQCREALQSATDFVIERAAGNPEEIGAASYAYMELMGLTLYCFMWQKIMASALKAKDLDSDYTQGLIKVGEFFLARQVPKAQSLLLEIEAGSESLMAMTAAQF